MKIFESAFWGTLKNKNRPPFIYWWAGQMIYSVLAIVDGILNLLVLHRLHFNFSMHFLFWNAKFFNDMNRKRKSL